MGRSRTQTASRRLSERQLYRRRKKVRLEIQEALERAEVMRLRASNVSIPEIAKHLGVSKKRVLDLEAQALARYREHIQDARGERYDEDAPPRHLVRIPRGPGVGPHVMGSPKHPDVIRATSDDVIEPDARLRVEAFELRRRGIPYAEIAAHLGVTEKQASEAVKQQLRNISEDELQDVDLARRMQIEQLDEMIRAVHVQATGLQPDGTRSFPMLDAMDRMMRLLKQKADLLGLNAPQKVDIERRLVVMANESGYDIEELRDIDVQVLKDLHAAGELKG